MVAHEDGTDTQMQDEIREKHGEAMREVHERFLELKAQGKLLRPEQPGNVIARLALSMDKELSGKFLRYVLLNIVFICGYGLTM